MNLKNPSMSSAVALVGVGLISLSGAMVFVASGRPAMAASGLDGRRGTRTLPITAEPGMPTAFEGAASVLAMGAADGCVEGEPLDWFGEIRELPACWIDDSGYSIELPYLPFDVGSTGAGFLGGLFDLNGDGRPESIVTRLSSEGDPWGACPLSLVDVSRSGDAWERTERCLVSAESFVKALSALGIPPSKARVEGLGWLDVDADGDLDLIFLTLVDWKNPRLLWLENTGFEATQSLTGDLDSDGDVDPADLTMLLGGWTGR